MTYEEEYFRYTNEQKLKIKQMEQTTISLQQQTPEVDQSALYLIDWEKVKTPNDLMLIVASLGISFSPLHPAWDMIKGFIDYTNPVKPNVPQMPEKKEMKLPKLKTIK